MSGARGLARRRRHRRARGNCFASRTRCESSQFGPAPPLPVSSSALSLRQCGLRHADARRLRVVRPRLARLDNEALAALPGSRFLSVRRRVIDLSAAQLTRGFLVGVAGSGYERCSAILRRARLVPLADAVVGLTDCSCAPPGKTKARETFPGRHLFASSQVRAV